MWNFAIHYNYNSSHDHLKSLIAVIFGTSTYKCGLRYAHLASKMCAAIIIVMEERGKFFDWH